MHIAGFGMKNLLENYKVIQFGGGNQKLQPPIFVGAITIYQNTLNKMN